MTVKITLFRRCLPDQAIELAAEGARWRNLGMGVKIRVAVASRTKADRKLGRILNGALASVRCTEQGVTCYIASDSVSRVRTIAFYVPPEDQVALSEAVPGHHEMRGDAEVLRWWERVGAIHARPSNVVSHAVGTPLLTYFLWQHDVIPAMAFGVFPMSVTVLWTYLRWRDKPSLSRAEQFLYERSTRLNVALTVIGVFTFLYGVWSHSNHLLVVVTLGTLLLAIFGVTRNAPGPRR